MPSVYVPGLINTAYRTLTALLDNHPVLIVGGTFAVFVVYLPTLKAVRALRTNAPAPVFVKIILGLYRAASATTLVTGWDATEHIRWIVTLNPELTPIPSQFGNRLTLVALPQVARAKSVRINRIVTVPRLSGSRAGGCQRINRRLLAVCSGSLWVSTVRQTHAIEYESLGNSCRTFRQYHEGNVPVRNQTSFLKSVRIFLACSWFHDNAPVR